MYRGVRDKMPLSKELLSSLGKLYKSESGAGVSLKVVRLSNYVIVNKGLTVTAILDVASKFPIIITPDDLQKLNSEWHEFSFTNPPPYDAKKIIYGSLLG